VAASLYDNIRLDTALAGILPVQTWEVNAEGYRDQNYVPIVTRRSITGQLHVHRTMDPDAPTAPYQLTDRNYELILTRAEYEAVRLLVGKILYFMPHVRDEADVAYRSVVVLVSVSEAMPFDPMLTYWRCAVHLQSADNNVVDT